MCLYYRLLTFASVLLLSSLGDSCCDSRAKHGNIRYEYATHRCAYSGLLKLCLSEILYLSAEKTGCISSLFCRKWLFNVEFSMYALLNAQSKTDFRAVKLYIFRFVCEAFIFQNCTVFARGKRTAQRLLGDGLTGREKLGTPERFAV